MSSKEETAKTYLREEILKSAILKKRKAQIYYFKEKKYSNLPCHTGQMLKL